MQHTWSINDIRYINYLVIGRFSGHSSMAFNKVQSLSRMLICFLHWNNLMYGTSRDVLPALDGWGGAVVVLFALLSALLSDLLCAKELVLGFLASCRCFTGAALEEILILPSSALLTKSKRVIWGHLVYLVLLSVLSSSVRAFSKHSTSRCT